MRGEIGAGGSPAGPPPAAFVEFIRYFTAGNHWRAHEVLAELWRGTREEQRRRFYQGLVQLAAAFIHAERGNMTGVQRLLGKAAENLNDVPSRYLGMDVPALVRAIADAAREASCCPAMPTMRR